MSTFIALLALWGMLFVVQLLWVAGAALLSWFRGQRPTKVRIGMGPRLLEFEALGFAWTLAPFPLSVSIEFEEGSDDEPPGALTAAVMHVTPWLLPLLVALVLVGPGRIVEQVLSGWRVLFEPAYFPQRLAHLGALVKDGQLGFALGAVIAKFVALEFLPVPPLTGGRLLLVPLQRRAPALVQRMYVLGYIALAIGAVLFVFNVVTAPDSPEEAARAGRARREAMLQRNRELSGQYYSPPLSARDFVSPGLIVFSVAMMFVALFRKAERKRRVFAEHYPARLARLGYRPAPHPAPSSAEGYLGRGAIPALGTPIELERDFHGQRVRYVASSRKAEYGAAPSQCWYAPLEASAPPWRLVTRDENVWEPWHDDAVPLRHAELDHRFVFAGDVQAFMSLLRRETVLRQTLLALAWVDLEVREDVAVFSDDLDRNSTRLAGGTLALLNTPHEELNVLCAVHEQIAELLARIARACR